MTNQDSQQKRIEVISWLQEVIIQVNGVGPHLGFIVIHVVCLFYTSFSSINVNRNQCHGGPKGMRSF